LKKAREGSSCFLDDKEKILLPPISFWVNPNITFAGCSLSILTVI